MFPAPTKPQQSTTVTIVFIFAHTGKSDNFYLWILTGEQPCDQHAMKYLTDQPDHAKRHQVDR